MPNSVVSPLSLLPPGASERLPHLLDATLTLGFFPYANALLPVGLQPPGVSCLVDSLLTYVGTNNAVGYLTHTMHKHMHTHQPCTPAMDICFIQLYYLIYL